MPRKQCTNYNITHRVKKKTIWSLFLFKSSIINSKLKTALKPEYQIEKEYPCFEGIQLSPTPPRSPSKKPKQQPITQIKVASNNSLPLLFSTV